MWGKEYILISYKLSFSYFIAETWFCFFSVTYDRIVASITSNNKTKSPQLIKIKENQNMYQKNNKFELIYI